jgi:hypothetical protein
VEAAAGFQRVGFGRLGTPVESVTGEKVPRGGVVGHRSVDGARADGVTAHTKGRQLQGHTLHETDDPVFGRYVVGVEISGIKAINGTDHDD